MAGRGGGGGGRGRGRGRGNQMSFDYNQLGFGGGEALPAPVLQPPPTFPLLEYKPIPLKTGPESEYMVALKRDFVEYFHSIRQYRNALSGIERFSDKYQAMSSNLKKNWDSQFYWDAMPSELNPKGQKISKRKREVKSSLQNKKTKIDISTRLDELAKLEDKEENESEEVKESEEKDQDEDNDRENIEEDEDEEMDDGTDYVNNYFDNGESYFDEEDDNLDDGPIY